MMRLYPKKLRNLEDLEREKKLLRKQSRQLGKEEFLTVESLLGESKKKKKGKDKEKEEAPPASLVDLLPISNPMIKMGLKILESRFMKGGRQKNSLAEDRRPHKNPIKTLAFEVLGGYAKWKAIELSYKGIRYLIREQKAKKVTTMTNKSTL